MTVRRPAPALPVALALVALLVVAAVGSDVAAAGEQTPDRPVSRVLVVSIPTVSWGDLEDEDLPNLRALLVINQLEPRTRLSRLMRGALAEVNLPAAETAIRRRMVYRNSVIRGCSVLDVGSQGAAAAQEIRQLTDEMVNLL